MAGEDYKGKLMRLFRELMLLMKSPEGIGVEALAEKLQVSRRTIYRDLDLLAQVGFPPIPIARGRFRIEGADMEARKLEKNLQFSAEEAGVLARAVAGLGADNPLRKTILEKLRSFSGMEDVLKAFVKQEISENYSRLARAMRDKKVVTLRNYRSAHSQSIRNRRIEPFYFSEDGVSVRGFELDSGNNKSYKIERIEEVVVESQGWRNSDRHENHGSPDIFGISWGDAARVRLRLSMRAAQLLQEEYPLSRPHLVREGASAYLFDGIVHSFKGVGRFVLGLLDEIEVLGPPELVTYLQSRLAEKKF